MHTFDKYLIPPLAAAAATVALAGSGWARDSVVNVSLWDKGAEAGMATGLGMGMTGANMSMAPMAIRLSTHSVAAGKVTFKVTNEAKDTIHEMVVAPIRSDAKPLPYIAAENEIDEKKVGDLGEVSELDPGQSGSLTLDLKPGKYVLFCNVPGHYMSGMWAELTVN